MSIELTAKQKKELAALSKELTDREQWDKQSDQTTLDKLLGTSRRFAVKQSASDQVGRGVDVRGIYEGASALTPNGVRSMDAATVARTAAGRIDLIGAGGMVRPQKSDFMKGLLGTGQGTLDAPTFTEEQRKFNERWSTSGEAGIANARARYDSLGAFAAKEQERVEGLRGKLNPTPRANEARMALELGRQFATGNSGDTFTSMKQALSVLTSILRGNRSMQADGEFESGVKKFTQAEQNDYFRKLGFT